MNTVRAAVVLMTLQRYLAMVLNFGTMVIASRILHPKEVGVAVIAASMANLVLSLREFASINYLVQKPDLTTGDKRAAFSVLTLATLVAVIVLLVSAPWIARLYEEPVLVPFFHILAVCALLELVTLPMQGMMQREMAFSRVALIATATALVTAVTTVSLAALGASSMSFAWATLAAAVTSAVLSLVLHRDLSIFGLTTRGLRSMVSFSSYVGANLVLYRIYETLPGMILGRTVSASAVGLYNRATNLSQLPEKTFLCGIIAVAVPAFSVRNRQELSLKEPYLRGVSYITGVQWPALASMAVLAHPIVHILLGPQWGEAVPIVRIMSLALLFSFTFELNFPVLMAIGAVKDLFQRALVAWPVSAVIVGIAAFFGLKAVAFSLFLAIPFQAYIAVRAVRKHIPMSWGEMALAVRPSVVATLASLVGPMSVVIWAGFRFDLSPLEGIVAGILAAPGWLIALWVTKHPLVDEAMHALAILRNKKFARRLIGDRIVAN